MAQITKQNKLYKLEDKIELPISQARAWEFLSNPGNLAALTPPKMQFRMPYEKDKTIYPGKILVFKVKPFRFFHTHLVSEITHVKEQEFFIDKQIYGPYAFWQHEHRLQQAAEGTAIIDLLYYKLPGGPLEGFAHALLVKQNLRYLFDYRKNQMQQIFGKPRGRNQE